MDVVSFWGAHRWNGRWISRLGLEQTRNVFASFGNFQPQVTIETVSRNKRKHMTTVMGLEAFGGFLS